MYFREATVTDLVTVGEATVRFSPPPGERIEAASEFRAHVDGPESNVAAAAAALGADVAWLSKLPETPLGRRVVRELRGHGVRTGVVWTTEGRTATAFVERGDTRGARAIDDRVDAAVTTVTPDELPLDAIREASACFVSGVTATRSATMAETARAAFDVAREAGTTTAFHPRFEATDRSPEAALERYEPLLERADVLVVNEATAEAVFGLDGEVVTVGHTLRTRYDCETVVVTRESMAHPAIGLRGEEISEAPVYETEVRDPAGAEDAFVGGFLTRRIRGDEMKTALTYGAAAAALKRTVRGDALVGSPDDVERIVSDAASARNRSTD